MSKMRTVVGVGGKEYRVTVQAVGQQFGFAGVVKALNGRIVHSTAPRGSEEAALKAAAEWAARS